MSYLHAFVKKAEVKGDIRDVVVAHCLECTLCASGADSEQALISLASLIKEHFIDARELGISPYDSDSELLQEVMDNCSHGRAPKRLYDYEIQENLDLRGYDMTGAEDYELL